MKRYVSRLLALSLTFCTSMLAVRAAEPVVHAAPVPPAESVPKTVPASAEEIVGPLPEYKYACADALFATISTAARIKGITVAGEQTLNLNVPGFRRAMPVKAVIQNHSAPLAVVLLGIGARTQSDFSKIWPSWLAEGDLHVLYFDSTFVPTFQRSSGRGVSGNLWSETQSASEIINAFLKRPEMQGKVSDVRVIGYSYGAVEALILGRMASEGKVPFQLAGIQAFDPPINLMTSAQILDTWYREDRWN